LYFFLGDIFLGDLCFEGVGFRDLVLHNLQVGACAMVGAERATPFGRRAAHQRFGAGIFVGDDPAAMIRTNRVLPDSLRDGLPD